MDKGKAEYNPELTPRPQSLPEQEGYDKGLEKAKEAPKESLDNSAGKGQPTAGLTLPLQPPPIMGVATTAQTDQTAAKSQAQAPSGLPAEDVDLIEKHWVEKAKEIVDKTANDPYAQKNEISKVGAEYKKTRFNKTVPTDNTVKT
jgi:hypothetical protein